ncbi:MAG: hypothetical protein ACREBV_08665, partial [Candidatus Zixiibacteriota bacterium]
MKYSKIAPAILLLISLSSLASAAIPQFIKYQGLLTDSSGVAIEGLQNMTFKLYDAAVNGNQLWTESQTVNVSQGLFQVSLGANNPLTQDVFDAAQVWLGITVGANPEISPRERIGAVPYALQAEVAQSVESTPGSPWIMAGNLLDLTTGSGSLIAYPSAEYEYGLEWVTSIFPAACFNVWTGGYIFQTTEPMLVGVDDATGEFSFGGVYFMFGTVSPYDDAATPSQWAYGLWTLDYFDPVINNAAKGYIGFGTGAKTVWA